MFFDRRPELFMFSDYRNCFMSCDYIKSIAVKLARRAMAQLMSFAQRKLFLLSARSGMDAWPSWDMLLANSTGNGTTPVAKSVTKIMCGPDSGMMPTILHLLFEYLQELMN